MPENLPGVTPVLAGKDSALIQHDRLASKQFAPPQPENRPDAKIANPAITEQVQQAVDRLNQAAKTFELEAHFQVYEDPNQVVVQMVDSRTGEVVREIPPRGLLERYADMMRSVGLAFDRKA